MKKLYLQTGGSRDLFLQYQKEALNSGFIWPSGRRVAYDPGNCELLILTLDTNYIQFTSEPSSYLQHMKHRADSLVLKEVSDG